MANESILTPGTEYSSTAPNNEDENKYLVRDNYLSEYEDEGEKSVVRENLNVYSKESVYTKLESDTALSEAIKKAFEKYLGQDDPHGILPQVLDMIKDFVKTDGSTPFKAPQSGLDPLEDSHFTTKKYVTKTLKEHTTADDPHDILSKVQDILEKYVKTSDVYTKSQVYTQSEINKQLVDYVKKDGTTSFTKPQIGIDPQIDSHLATKRYIDKVLYQHLVDVDPHGFITILNNRLASYIKRSEVYDRTQTYSRTQIDNIIQNLVNQAVGYSISEFVDSINEKFEHIRLQRYVKRDGSIPFINPQAGVDAVEEEHLTTLRQVTELLQAVKEDVEQQIIDKKCDDWITTGPVLGSAGLVETGTVFAKTVSLQEILDAIFYGKGLSIHAPEFGVIGSQVDVEVCVQGSTAEIEHAELYQNGKLIASFTKDDFKDQLCIVVRSDKILEDTEFVFKAFFENGSYHEVNAWTKVALPVFIGLLPQWKFGNTTSYEYLIQLWQEDPNNNKFYDVGKNVKSLQHIYSYSDPEWKHIFLAVPADYPDLSLMSTPSQQFGPDAFNIIDMIPFRLPNTESDTIYKLYIYKESLIRANIPVTFNFEQE